jgi:hypothetical protein
MVQITAARERDARSSLPLPAFSAATAPRRRHASGSRAGMTAGTLLPSSKQALLAFCQEDTLAGLHATLRTEALDLRPTPLSP